MNHQSQRRPQNKAGRKSRARKQKQPQGQGTIHPPKHEDVGHHAVTNEDRDRVNQKSQP